jgi:DnaJ-class molecular chaperone
LPGPSPAEVRALAGLIDELSYYDILELKPEAPASEVRRAYHRVSRRFHPDANRRLQGAARDALEQVAKRVSEAYQVLRDGRRRKAYDGELSGGRQRLQLVEAEARADRRSVEDHLGHTPNGRRFFGLARSDIDNGDLTAAQRNLKMALTFEPQNASFRRKLEEVQQALRG